MHNNFPLCSLLPAPPAQGVWLLTTMSSYRVACLQLERIRSGPVPWIPLSTSSTRTLGKVRPGKVVVFFRRQFVLLTEILPCGVFQLLFCNCSPSAIDAEGSVLSICIPFDVPSLAILKHLQFLISKLNFRNFFVKIT